MQRLTSGTLREPDVPMGDVSVIPHACLVSTPMLQDTQHISTYIWQFQQLDIHLTMHMQHNIQRNILQCTSNHVQTVQHISADI